NISITYSGGDGAIKIKKCAFFRAPPPRVHTHPTRRTRKKGAPDSCFRLACLLSDFDVCAFIFTPSFKKFLVVPPPPLPIYPNAHHVSNGAAFSG
ncbi:hypothetical protein P4N39_RS25060, partial [Escherichia coli]